MVKQRDGMGQISEFFHSFRKGKEGGKGSRDKWVLLVLAGLLLLVIIWPVDNGQKADGGLSGTETKAGAAAAAVSDTPEDYARTMEERLTAILEKVEGAGQVQVMITVKSTSEQVLEKDEAYSESRSVQSGEGESSVTSNSVSRSEATVYDNGSSGGSPYVIKELQPEVEGILVVAEGGGNENVVNEITYAVQVLFDVPVHKIKVVKMSK